MNEATTYCWKNAGVITHQDGSSSVDGWHEFCCGSPERSDFFIQEVAVCYADWGEEERQRRFNGAKYVWGGCSDGVGYADRCLKADNIEDARQEFEEWYEQHLVSRVERLKQAVSEAAEDYEQFLMYKQSTRQR